MPSEYFINADFDLGLRCTRDRPPSAASIRQAEELPFHFLLLATGGDSVLVPHALDDEVYSSFERVGLEIPATTLLQSARANATLTPFGWDHDAAERNERYRKPAARPPLDVVRRVNGRRFAADLEGRLADDGHLLGVYSTTDEIVACLHDRPPGESGWIVKSEHGNAGLGNRRLRFRELTTDDRRVIERLLDEDECVLIERFRPRVVDLAAIFEVESDGSMRQFSVHEVVNTADGAFLGVILDAESPTVERYRERLQEAAGAVARELAREGYFGPVGMDAFVWDDHGRQRLRPLVDLNARLCMSAPAHRLWTTWDQDRVVYWRLFSGRKLQLPSTVRELETALAGDAYSSLTRCGVLLTSPIRNGGRRPLRYSVLLAGRTRTEVEDLDRRFRTVFER